MRPLFVLIVSLFVTCFSFAQQKQQPDNFIRPLPKPARAVNDFGNFLTVTEQQNLEKELSAYWKATTNAIVILTLDSLPVDPATKNKQTIEKTALLYFNTWGIGDSIKNNGVLILLSKYDRQVRIEVGKGLEKILTNEICANIIAQQIVPHFKKQAFFTGLQEAIQALKKALSEGKQSAAWKQSAKFDIHKLPPAEKQGVLVFIIPIVILIIVWQLLKKSRNKSAAGGMINPGYQDQDHLLNNINDQHIINNSIMAAGAMNMMDTSPDPGMASPPDTPAANDAGSGSFDSGGSSFDSGGSSFDGGASSGGGASGDW